MHAILREARRVLAVFHHQHQAGVEAGGVGDDFRELGMQAEREDQHVGAKFFQRHDGLFIVVGLRDHAHLIFHRQHLGGAGAEDSLVIGQNQFQHTRVVIFFAALGRPPRRAPSRGHFFKASFMQD